MYFSESTSSDEDEVELDESEMEDLCEKISYLWVVEKVHHCATKVNYFTLTSPSFYSKNCDFKWKMDLETGLQEGTSESSKYLSLYLRAVRIPNDVVKAKFTVSLRTSRNCVIKTKSGERSFTEGNALGFPKMIRFSDLLTYVPDRILKVYAEVWVGGSEVNDPVSTPILEPPEERLQKSMNELFETSEHKDVVFEVEEEALSAHQCILSARSPVFAAMFAHESTWVEKNSGVIKIVDFEKESFALFLRFVYSGQVVIPSVRAAMDLFRAGDKYHFQDLKLLCQNYISTNLNSSNVGEVLLLAEIFCAQDLKKTAMNYMLKNIKFFCDANKEVYKLLEKENPQLLTEFLIAGTNHFREKINPKSSRNRE